MRVCSRVDGEAAACGRRRTLPGTLLTGPSGGRTASRSAAQRASRAWRCACAGGQWRPCTASIWQPAASSCSASATCGTSGCRLSRIGLQPPSHGAAASVTWGCSLRHVGLQPSSRGGAASVTWGCSLRHVGVQPPSHGVAASVAWVCHRLLHGAEQPYLAADRDGDGLPRVGARAGARARVRGRVGARSRARVRDGDGLAHRRHDGEQQAAPLGQEHVRPEAALERPRQRAAQVEVDRGAVRLSLRASGKSSACGVLTIHPRGSRHATEAGTRSQASDGLSDPDYSRNPIRAPAALLRPASPGRCRRIARRGARPPRMCAACAHGT